MENELSLVRFAFMNFWGVLIQSRPLQPISTLLIKLTEALINSDPEPDKKALERVKWLYEHTSEEIDAHLSIVELIVFRNIDKGVMKEVEIGDKSFYLSELYYVLDGISKELTEIVIKIAKKYNFDMPYLQYGNSQNQKIGFE